MQLKSLEGCQLRIGKYPPFSYNAYGGGGKGILLPSNKVAPTKIRQTIKQVLEILSHFLRFIDMTNQPMVQLVKSHKICFFRK